jgi:hypothetical protein
VATLSTNFTIISFPHIPKKALMKTLAQLHLKVFLGMGQLEDAMQLLLKVDNIHLHDSLLYNWHTTLVLFLSWL